MLDFKILTLDIGRRYTDTYNFLADGRSFATWGGSDPLTPVVPLGRRDWMVQLDGAPMVLRLCDLNPYGVLDLHVFALGGQPGPVIPVRLSRNRDGCELCYVHFRHREQSDEQFASEVEWLQSDLLRLKTFLEKDRPPAPMYRSQVTALSIARPVSQVYRFLAEPRNFPKWAVLASGRFEHRGGRDWLAGAAPGARIVRFGEPNRFGVLDHAVFSEGEEPLFVPVRVLANEEATLLTYTFLQGPGVTDEEFDSTIEQTTTDLLTAKILLEA